MSLEQKNTEKIMEGEHLCNNIIYYDDSLNCEKNYEIFSKNTPGTFIFCNNLDSFKLIKSEILQKNEKDKNIVFNLIINSLNIDEIINLIKEEKDFEACIKNICLYGELNKKHEKVIGVYNNPDEIIEFIKKYSSNEIKPFPINKLVKYEDYLETFKNKHFQISKLYGNLDLETYKENLEKIKSLINQDNQSNNLKIKSVDKIIDGFTVFNIEKDLESLDKLIIKEYTKNTFYGDLNKWLMDSNNSNEAVAYFTSRLMYSLNSYAKKNKAYFDKNEIYRGIKLPYISLLEYEKAKGKIISFPMFLSTNEEEKIAKLFSGRETSKGLYKNRLCFSVVYFIKNNLKENWISNGINIQDVSMYTKEKEIVFLPFSFFYVRDVKIDIVNYTADIYLETIGKEEILEEKIQMGKEIEYNKEKGIMQVKQ